MECKFVVGQKVTPTVDIKWGFPTNYGPFVMTNQPIMGEVYTISEFDDRFTTIGLYFVEFPHAYLPDGQAEPGFEHTFFRAIDDDEVEAANEMLRKITDRVKEPV